MTYTPQHLKRWTRPQNYAGAQWPDYYVVYGWTRDSDLLTRHNAEEITAALEAITPDDWPEDTQPDGPVINPRESHWACGWVEWIGVHKDQPELLRLADDLARRLDAYPILNEDRYGEKEYTAVSEYWAGCSVRDRIEYLARAHLSIYAARRDYLPKGDDGTLFEILRDGL